MIIKVTGEIRLRGLGDDDARELFDLIEMNRRSLREWLPWLDTQRTMHDSLRFIRETRMLAERNEALTMGILYQEKLAGVISFHRYDWANRAGMIGYWLDARCRGKGVMTEACRAFTDHGFRQVGLHRIDIRCAPGNRKSCAIPERLGFVNEGTLRDAEWLYDHYVDLIVYSMLAPEWKNAHHVHVKKT